FIQITRRHWVTESSAALFFLNGCGHVWPHPRTPGGHRLVMAANVENVMVVERDIVGALEARGVGVVRSTVVAEYQGSFGDIVVDVDSSLGRLRLTSDRGQLYVDVLAAD